VDAGTVGHHRCVRTYAGDAGQPERIGVGAVRDGPRSERYSCLCSRKSTGLPSSNAASSSPFASSGVAGKTTLSPATHVNHASTLWEWNGPAPTPVPTGTLTTTGMRAPQRKWVFPRLLTIWLKPHEALGHLEDAPVLRDVLSDQDYLGAGAHRLPQSLRDRVHVAEVAGRRGLGGRAGVQQAGCEHVGDARLRIRNGIVRCESALHEVVDVPLQLAPHALAIVGGQHALPDQGRFEAGDRIALGPLLEERRRHIGGAGGFPFGCRNAALLSLVVITEDLTSRGGREANRLALPLC